MPIIESLPVGPLQTNCYLLGDEATRACAIIDPGDEPETIARAIARRDLRPALILLTHAHFDHIGAVGALRERYGARVGISEIEAPFLADARLSGAELFGFSFEPSRADFTIAEGDQLRVGELTLTALETPGHSPGGLSYLGGTFVFVGDVLFRDGIGRYDLPGASSLVLARSLERLLALNGDTTVYPGHGPATTITREARMNPHLAFLGIGGR